MTNSDDRCSHNQLHKEAASDDHNSLSTTQ